MKKKLLTGLAVACAAAMMAGCGSGETAETTTAAATTAAAAEASESEETEASESQEAADIVFHKVSH